MRFSDRGLRDEPEINLTSLIDVVFTLIIFFVVTTTFDARNTLKLQLPSAASATVEAPREPLVVVVDAEGRYFVGGSEVLRRDAASLREAIGKVAGDDKSRAVILRADGKTPHQSVVMAMDAIGQLGFSRLSIATVPPEQGSQ